MRRRPALVVAAGVCERDSVRLRGLQGYGLAVSIRRIAPAPSGHFRDGVGADFQALDGHGAVAVDHNLLLEAAPNNFENEALVLVDSFPSGLCDGQGVGLNMNQECGVALFFGHRPPAIRIAALMHERGIAVHDLIPDFDRDRNGNILVGICAISEFASIWCIGDVQFRFRTEHFAGNSLCAVVFPIFRADLVCSAEISRNSLAIVGGGILECQFWFEDIDLSTAAAGFLDCCFTLSACRGGISGRNFDGDSVLCIVSQIIQLVRNGFAVFVLDLDRDIDIFRLPALKAIVILAEIRRHFADLDSCVVLEVRGSNFALEVDILVLDCDGHVLDGDIDGGFIERFDWCS